MNPTNLWKYALPGISPWLEQGYFWQPPVQEFPLQVNSAPRTNLKIAALVGERLFTGLRFEAHLRLLTPTNYPALLHSDPPPDLVLVEPCQQSVTGHWTFSQTVNNREARRLHNLLAMARELHIPCCYWFTVDHIYIRHFKRIFSSVDHIFCADQKATDILHKEGYPATTLSPCIQPRVHHPFRVFSDSAPLHIPTLFDGWADLLHFGPELPLAHLDVFDLHIIESGHIITEGMLPRTAEHQKKILGCVSAQDRLSTLRHSNAAISFAQTLATPTEQEWQAVETAGCRVPLVHLGPADNLDLRTDICLPVEDLNSMRSTLARLLEEPLFREETAQRLWRETHTQHTFAKRMACICTTLGIDHNEPRSPMISVITPTNRPKNIQKVIHTFKLQNYPEKELIIIFNGPAEEYPTVERAVQQTQDQCIRIRYLPTEYFAGMALNIGAHMAQGEYCCRMDDDDHYFSQYLSDMILHLNAVDADIFGKPPVHLYFEEERELYLRWSPTALSRLPNQQIQAGKIWLGGNTIAGRTDVLIQHPYPDTVFGTADSAFLIEAAQYPVKIYSFDQCNIVASRRRPETHTWQYNNEQLKKKAHLAADLTIREISQLENIFNRTSPGHICKLPAPAKKKKNILYFGPQILNKEVWRNRVKYIYPDLFAPLADHFVIHMMTGPIPAYALPGISELQERYGIVFHELPPRKGTDPYMYWIRNGGQYAATVDADILSNIFGGVLFGYALTSVARQLELPSIVRMAGDEIESRIAIGTYLRKHYYLGCEQHKIDMRKQILALDRADRIIVMSPWERDRVVAQGADPDRVRVVIRGIDLDRFSPPKKRRKKQPRKFLYVGRNSLEKGYDIIEQAARLLRRSHPKLKFIFAGNFERGKTGNSNYLGFVKTDDLPALYRSVDALILSSRAEGMPQVVLEAMASGVPCILSRHLFETMFTDGVEALLTELDPEYLAAQIVRLHNDPSLADRLAAAGRKFAEYHFDKRKLQNEYRDVFLELLEQ